MKIIKIHNLEILIEHIQYIGAANLCAYRHRAHNVECQMANNNKNLTKHDHHQMRDCPPPPLSFSTTVAILIIFELYLFMYIHCTNSNSSRS